MLTVTLSGLLYTIVKALLALVVARASLWMFDRKMGFQFKEWINGSDNHSLSIYFGLRFVGVCLLFGFIFS